MAVLSSMSAWPAPRPSPHPGAMVRERTRIFLRRSVQYLERRPECRGLILAASPHALATQLRSRGLARLELATEPVHLGGWQVHLPALLLSPSHPGPTLLVLCEGVGDELEAPQLRALLTTLGDRAPPGSRILLDVHSGWAMRWHGVRGRGLNRIDQLTAPHRRLRLDAVHPMAERCGPLPALLGLAFRIASGLPWRAVYELGVDP
jgi:hypothetical protein